jgi:hypothetical protein
MYMQVVIVSTESEKDSSQEQTQLVQCALTWFDMKARVAARKTAARQSHLETCTTYANTY